MERFLATGIADLLFADASRIRNRARFFEGSLTAPVGAQLETRRAQLIPLEGIPQTMKLVPPAEGYTRPYLVMRDQQDRLVAFSLAKDAAAAAREKMSLFRRICLPPDFPGAPGSREVVLEQISSCRFPGAGAGGVVLDLSSTVEGKEFSRLSMVRLKEVPSFDGI